MVSIDLDLNSLLVHRKRKKSPEAYASEVWWRCRLLDAESEGGGVCFRLRVQDPRESENLIRIEGVRSGRGL